MYIFSRAFPVESNKCLIVAGVLVVVIEARWHFEEVISMNIYVCRRTLIEDHSKQDWLIV